MCIRKPFEVVAVYHKEGTAKLLDPDTGDTLIADTALTRHPISPGDHVAVRIDRTGTALSPFQNTAIYILERLDRFDIAACKLLAEIVQRERLRLQPRVAA